MVRFNLLTKKYEFIPMNNAGNRAVGDVLCMCYSKDSTFYLGAEFWYDTDEITFWEPGGSTPI